MNAPLRAALLLAGLAGVTAGCQSSGRPVVVGSKSFTESVILGEMVAALVRGAAPPSSTAASSAAPRSSSARSRPAPSTSIPSTPGR